MRGIKKALIAAAIILFITIWACFGYDNILLWQVDENATVDGTPFGTFISFIPDDYDNYPAVRVVASGGNLTEPKCLAIWVESYTDPDTGETYPAGWESGYNGVWTFTDPDEPEVSRNFGTAWTQSLLDNDITAECLFQMQLGQNTWSDAADDYVWVTLAMSDQATMDALIPYIYETFDLNPLTATPWSVIAFHTTPEPNASVLLALGTGFVMLRRKKICV